MNAPKGEETIFAEALRRPPDERAAYVAEATAGNPQLRQEVESLLHGYETGDFLEVAAASDLRPTLHVTVPVTEKPGDTIGRYKLLQQIGEGGCGVVYMAEQTEPVRRRVALKIIKLGMDTKSVIARFEAERQALALMDHPNIAKVFDAGATETGRPYFVMELVRGMKITEFCDEKKLSTKQRLDLFVEVCQAIQHAHQKGIIHRDIKPSNILVSVNDGVTMPKIIDFGIAKATSGQQLTDKTLFTAFEQFIGTPAYMSPEQAMITNVDIDTRSDIYALGVLLYELLTGKTPFDAKELFAIGLDEMRRTIREQEPARPSTRLSTLAQNELSTTAQRRGLDAPKLVSELRGDLDWIVMKALEKDRARRYETANGLAADIQRHLNNEPVVACPPSRLYRLQKTVRRNKIAFAATAAVMAALSLGSGVSTWMFLRERAAKREQLQLRERADTEAGKSQQVAQFLKRMLAGVGPSVALGRDTLMLREILDITAISVSRDLRNQPEVEIELLLILSKTYAELGRYREARDMAQKALDVARPLGEMRPVVADALDALGEAEKLLDHYREAERLMREGLALRRKLYGAEHLKIAESLNNLGLVLLPQVKQEATLLFRESLAIRRKLLGEESLEVASTAAHLATALSYHGELEEAERLIRSALVTQQKLLPSDHPRIARTLRTLGDILSRRHRDQDADDGFRAALEGARKSLHPQHPELVGFLVDAGKSAQKRGQSNEAEGLFREALSIETNSRSITGYSLTPLAHLLSKQGRAGEAENLFNDLLSQPWLDPAKSALILYIRATCRASDGRFSDAAVDLGRAYELDSNAAARSAGSIHTDLAIMLVRSGNVEGYREHCRKMLRRFANSTYPNDAERVAKSCLILPDAGLDLELVGKLADVAVAAPTNHPDMGWFRFTKALAEYRLGQYESTLKWLGRVSPNDAKSEAGLERTAVCIMALHQLNRLQESRALLTAALALSENVQNNWRDGIVAHCLLREAQALIDASSEAK